MLYDKSETQVVSLLSLPSIDSRHVRVLAVARNLRTSSKGYGDSTSYNITVYDVPKSERSLKSGTSESKLLTTFNARLTPRPDLVLTRSGYTVSIDTGLSEEPQVLLHFRLTHGSGDAASAALKAGFPETFWMPSRQRNNGEKILSHASLDEKTHVAAVAVRSLQCHCGGGASAQTGLVWRRHEPSGKLLHYRFVGANKKPEDHIMYPDDPSPHVTILTAVKSEGDEMSASIVVHSPDGPLTWIEVTGVDSKRRLVSYWRKDISLSAHGLPSVTCASFSGDGRFLLLWNKAFKSMRAVSVTSETTSIFAPPSQDFIDNLRTGQWVAFAGCPGCLALATPEGTLELISYAHVLPADFGPYPDIGAMDPVTEQLEQSLEPLERGISVELPDKMTTGTFHTPVSALSVRSSSNGGTGMITPSPKDTPDPYLPLTLPLPPSGGSARQLRAGIQWAYYHTALFLGTLHHLSRLSKEPSRLHEPSTSTIRRLALTSLSPTTTASYNRAGTAVLDELGDKAIAHTAYGQYASASPNTAETGVLGSPVAARESVLAALQVVVDKITTLGETLIAEGLEAHSTIAEVGTSSAGPSTPLHNPGTSLPGSARLNIPESIQDIQMQLNSIAEAIAGMQLSNQDHVFQGGSNLNRHVSGMDPNFASHSPRVGMPILGGEITEQGSSVYGVPETMKSGSASTAAEGYLPATLTIRTTFTASRDSGDRRLAGQISSEIEPAPSPSHEAGGGAFFSPMSVFTSRPEEGFYTPHSSPRASLQGQLDVTHDSPLSATLSYPSDFNTSGGALQHMPLDEGSGLKQGAAGIAGGAPGYTSIYNNTATLVSSSASGSTTESAASPYVADPVLSRMLIGASQVPESVASNQSTPSVTSYSPSSSPSTVDPKFPRTSLPIGESVEERRGRPTADDVSCMTGATAQSVDRQSGVATSTESVMLPLPSSAGISSSLPQHGASLAQMQSPRDPNVGLQGSSSTRVTLSVVGDEVSLSLNVSQYDVPLGAEPYGGPAKMSAEDLNTAKQNVVQTLAGDEATPAGTRKIHDSFLEMRSGATATEKSFLPQHPVMFADSTHPAPKRQLQALSEGDTDRNFGPASFFHTLSLPTQIKPSTSSDTPSLLAFRFADPKAVIVATADSDLMVITTSNKLRVSLSVSDANLAILLPTADVGSLAYPISNLSESRDDNAVEITTVDDLSVLSSGYTVDSLTGIRHSSSGNLLIGSPNPDNSSSTKDRRSPTSTDEMRSTASAPVRQQKVNRSVSVKSSLLAEKYSNRPPWVFKRVHSPASYTSKPTWANPQLSLDSPLNKPT